MSVIYFLVLVGVLVVIHEFGHFFAAKLLGFKVIRFSIGFGQPLFRIRGPETEYQLALFPLGGYVRILGEDPDDVIPEELSNRAFSAKPLWQRLIVVFAGPFANFCLPIAIYFVSFAGDTELPAAVVGDVLQDTPADRAGIQPGDQIISIDGESTRYWHDVESTSLVIERTLVQGDQLNYVEDGSREHSLPTIMARAFPADLRVASDHAQHFLVNGLMLGRGKDVARGLVPDELIDRPKHGFMPPVGEWLTGELRGFVEELLGDPQALSTRYIRPSALRSWLNRLYDGERHLQVGTWILLCFEVWLRGVQHESSP